MKTLIKITSAILISFSLFSCQWEENTEPPKETIYPYNPDQELIVNVKVVPMGDVQIHFDQMDKEVNADYMNRYGIGVKLTLAERVEIPEPLKRNVVFVPERKSEKITEITAYILPKEYYNMPNSVGYAAIGTNAVVIREDGQRDRTLAHEIGHILGLHHIDLPHNTMKISAGIGMYGEPNNFVPEQIDTMTTAITLNKNLYNKSAKGITGKQTIKLVK